MLALIADALNIKGNGKHTMAKNSHNKNGTRREDQATPKWLVTYLDKICGFDFMIDLAANKSNAICWAYIDEEQNLLSMDTAELQRLFPHVNLESRWAFCNPPYPKGGLGTKWPKTLTTIAPNVVVLIPASVGTQWFEKFLGIADAVVLISKRLHFDEAPHGAQFDSALYIKGDILTSGQIKLLQRIGTVITKPGINNWEGDASYKLAEQIANDLV